MAGSRGGEHGGLRQGGLSMRRCTPRTNTDEERGSFPSVKCYPQALKLGVSTS